MEEGGGDGSAGTIYLFILCVCVFFSPPPNSFHKFLGYNNTNFFTYTYKIL